MTTLPNGASFTWRLLTLKEYQVFRSLRDGGVLHPYVLYDKAFDRCFLGESAIIDPQLPAGLFISIGQLIMYLSGDCAGETQKQDLMMAREAYHADSVIEHLKRVCLLAFPSYTLEDVEKWTRPELIRKFTISEAVLVNRGIGYEPLDPKNIMSVADREAAQQKQQGIDFARENREIGSAMNGSDGHHPMDLPPDEFAKRQRVARVMEERRQRRRG